MTDRPDRAQVGKIGEDTACKYLQKHGFTIIERNYWQKWGEIDVVAEKDKVLHFVEVKSVIRGVRLTPRSLASRGPGSLTSEPDYDPEENVHPWKLKRLSRAIQTYLLQRNVPDDKEWQVDVLTVELDFETRRARVKLLPDIGL
ncbi:MAG TPA: YraN family protein [Candidatus Paceibacterota bacterium]